MLGKMIRSSDFRVSGFRCEDLIFIRFYLQMLNDKMVKPNNKTCLKCKYQLKLIYNYKKREIVATNEKCIT